MVKATSKTVVALGLVLTAALVVYLPILTSLVRQWASDENYSHGFIIVPFAVYFAWRERRTLSRITPRPRAAGLVLVIVSLLVLIAGELGAELFLTRVSLIGVIAGAILFLYGWRHLRVLAFPIGLLILMIPLPAV